jgi:hypothetical protein
MSALDDMSDNPDQNPGIDPLNWKSAMSWVTAEGFVTLSNDRRGCSSVTMALTLLQ